MYRKLLILSIVWTVGLALPGAASQDQPTLVYAKDGSGVFGYKDTPILPWCGYHKHDPDRPAPPKVTPGTPGTPQRAGTAPSDAIVLFGGTDLSKWHESEWGVENGYAEARGEIPLVSKDAFGDCQLHLEWQAPDPPEGDRMNRGNNGVYIMGLFEIQIFDSYTTKIYPDGQAASVYGETPPLVNVCRKPGEWQSFDIIFSAPVFQFGRLVKRATVTVLHNGVLVHLNQEIMGPTTHRTLGYYSPLEGRRPLILGSHDNPVRFRNIWIRPL